MITLLGFADLASSTPAGRLGQTMGAAELGREVGDAGGPLVLMTEIEQTSRRNHA